MSTEAMRSHTLTASGSIAAEPLRSAPTALATAIARLATMATRTVTVLSAASSVPPSRTPCGTSGISGTSARPLAVTAEP